MKFKITLFLALFSFVGLSSFANNNSEPKDEDVAIVYYVKEITAENVLKLYKLLGVDLQGKTGVKIHFGEEGNKNFLNPELCIMLLLFYQVLEHLIITIYHDLIHILYLQVDI